MMNRQYATIQCSKGTQKQPVPRRMKVQSLLRDSSFQRPPDNFTSAHKHKKKPTKTSPSQNHHSSTTNIQTLDSSSSPIRKHNLPHRILPSLSKIKKDMESTVGLHQRLRPARSDWGESKVNRKKIKVQRVLPFRSSIKSQLQASFQPTGIKKIESRLLCSYLTNQMKKRHEDQGKRLDKSSKKLVRRIASEGSGSNNSYFPTVLGQEPSFHTLKTYYASHFSKPRRLQLAAEEMALNQVPRIPEESELAEFIENYVSLSKQIDTLKLSSLPNFYASYRVGEFYFGEMEDQVWEGLGVLITQKSCFEGYFSMGHKKKGYEVSSIGIYRGQYRNGLREGAGQFQSADGQYYVGQWKADHRHGNGSLSNKKGHVYNGEWKNDKFHGYGALASEQSQYKGSFHFNRKQGWGREKFTNGDAYQGVFFNGLPDQKGSYVWSNGTQYEGQFQKGFRTGRGSLTTADGSIYTGSFIDEEPMGLCQIVFPNGDLYKGFCKNGKKNGRGRLFIQQSQVQLCGFWQDDFFLKKMDQCLVIFLLLMSEEQIEQTQRRLQMRKGQRKSYKKHLQNDQFLQRSRSNPNPQAKSYLRPGKIYLRSLNPQSRKNYFTIDTDMRPFENRPRPYLSHEKSQSKLPPIRKMKLIRIDNSDRKVPKNHNYLQPTNSSERLFEGKKKYKAINDGKKLCSVHCHSRHEKVRNKKRNQLSRVKLQSRNCQSMVEDYLCNEAKSRYPQTQLRSYLSRMKQQDEQSHQNGDEGLRYTTYFGLQPEFYQLKTEYVAQMYEHGPTISSIENYKPYVIPSIPDRGEIAQFIQNYHSFGKQINISKLIKQPNFLVQYTPNELYFGQMEGDEREGLGILLTEKACFEGLFRGNQKVKGVQVNSSGLYRGEFYRNKKDGNGEFQWINGEYYIGQWKEGYRHGKGVWNNSKGDSFNGQWIRGRGEGHGIYKSAGRQYHGDFLDFKKDGWGREKLFNGDYYEGGFKEGLPQGKGVYVWSNGTKYQGQFSHGFRNGKGVLSTLDGYSYNGEFVDEKPQGLCQLLMPNGDMYQGCLRNGKKNGRGILIFAKSREKFDGYWQNDRFLSRAV